jgi:protein tyrosine/serine phosphatase
MAEDSPQGKIHSVTANNSDLSGLNLPALKEAKVLIPNLHLVSPGLLRGEQPSQDALALLKKAGVRTVVNLRNEDILIQQEAAQALSLGLNYVSIPMDVFNRPADLEVQRFLATVIDAANQPVYVHCQHGEDRTGTMCAIFRMTQQGWPVDQAYQEMISLGFKPVLEQLSQTVYAYGNSSASKTAVTPASSFLDDVRARSQADGQIKRLRKSRPVLKD